MQAQIDRLTVTAPCDGRVLKRNIDVGEITGVEGAAAAFVVGDVDVLHVRARIDEEDLQGLRAGAEAIARVRGGGDSIVLEMVRIEPLAIPKADLAGLPSERVDTRVVEVVFRVVDPGKANLVPGTLVDVFIDAGTGSTGRTGG